MIDRFLKAKHWQLFGLMFGVPMILYFIMIGSIIISIDIESNPDPATFFSPMKFYPIIMIIYMGLFFGWFWSIAIGLQKKVPKNVKMKVKKFKIFFFIPLIYMTFFSILISVFFIKVSDGYIPENGIMGGMAVIIIPLHLFSMFCLFYLLYFVSKTFKTVELQREVKFEDFIGEFFMLWFYPIGIWIIQPKINKMVT